MTDTGTRELTARCGTLGFAAAALAGILAGAAVLGIGELVGAILDPRPSPFFAAGATVVDHTPQHLREEAIRRFGSHDKDVLFAAMGAAMVVLAALCGVLERRRRIGSAVFVVLGIAISAAALRRPDAQWWCAIPTAAGVLAGLIVLRLMLPHGGRDTQGQREAPERHDVDSAESPSSAKVPVDPNLSGATRLARRRFLAIQVDDGPWHAADLTTEYSPTPGANGPTAGRPPRAPTPSASAPPTPPQPPSPLNAAHRCRTARRGGIPARSACDERRQLHWDAGSGSIRPTSQTWEVREVRTNGRDAGKDR
ncbi:hypothetical protein [Nocardia africana]|uniref:Uncharacterized protein n=1 Tax=Nocardia africana TaxID=134964 RepID=A0A378X7B5_9NOCA|nr:hypothetical protein [Nocardia africana]SUA48561.1 Uncharacterised protein [Nocardia africana]